MGRTSVNLSGWILDNPIIPASGAFGFGYSHVPFYDVNILGSMALKGTTLHPRFGNPTPRIAETPSGMLNSVGLQNPGIHEVLEKEIPKLNKVFDKKVVFNISGFSVEEYGECAKLADKEDKIGIIEVNISCPNVKDGGMSLGSNAESAARVTKIVRENTDKLIYIKLSPNVTNIVEIAKACEAEGADGISMINTLLGARFDLKTARPILANIKGGLSGPAIFPVALRMVYEVFESVDIPIIGMGGVASAEDVIEMMYAGATAVEIGAQNLVNPMICKEIIDDLPGLMNKLGIENLQDIIGRAHR